MSQTSKLDVMDLQNIFRMLFWTKDKSLKTFLKIDIVLFYIIEVTLNITMKAIDTMFSSTGTCFLVVDNLHATSRQKTRYCYTSTIEKSK